MAAFIWMAVQLPGIVASKQTDPVILVVDDEEDVADTYALRLQSEYETRVAYGGEQALEKIDDDIDAVLLDRRMPDIHGDDVLEEIRNRGYDCPVIMSTAVDPDLNILEMDFDDYLCKPIFRETLLNTLDQHIDTTSQKSQGVDEFLALVSKVDLLKEELSAGELKESEEFNRLKTEIQARAAELREEVDDLDEMMKTYRSIERESS